MCDRNVLLPAWTVSGLRQPSLCQTEMLDLIYWVTKAIFPTTIYTHQNRFVLFQISSNLSLFSLSFFLYFLFFSFQREFQLLQPSPSVCILFECTETDLGKEPDPGQRERGRGWEVNERPKEIP